jgi:hypothetical protein
MVNRRGFKYNDDILRKPEKESLHNEHETSVIAGTSKVEIRIDPFV